MNTELNAEINTTPATWDTYTEMRRRLFEGSITAAEIKDHWKRFKRDRPTIQASFEAMKKAEIIKACDIRPSDSLAKDTKKDMIEGLLDRMEVGHVAKGIFTWSPFSESKITTLDRQIESITDEDIQERAAKAQKEHEEMLAKREKALKAINDPQTLEDFELRKQYKAPALTPEQQRLYDDLVALASLAKRKEETQAKATVAPVDLQGVSMTLQQTKHTKTGADLFVVVLSARVERHVYDELNAKANKLGGWYSTYRRDGAIPGFLFKSEEPAKEFMGLADGQAADASPVMEGRQEEKKARTSNKFLEMAQSMEDKANAVLKADRKTNTPRRANQAAHVLGAAEADKALAQTLRNLGEAMEAGELQFLARITTRAQVEELDTILLRAKSAHDSAQRQAGGRRIDWEETKARAATLEDVDYTKFPWPAIYSENLKDHLDALGQVIGLSRIAATLRKMADAVQEGCVVFKTPEQIDMLLTISEKLRDKNTYELRGIKDRVKDSLLDYQRLKAAGITNEHELRAALREYLDYKGDRPKSDPVKAAEMALVGRKIPGYVPTPMTLAGEVVAKADIRPGMTLLEPSAGKGNLLDAVRAQHGDSVHMEAIEPISCLRDILTAKGYSLVGFDVMEHQGQYDRVIMNPPFEHRQDVDHVLKAYDLLAPGGRLVAIMGEGTFFGSDKKAQSFREWLSDKGYSEKNPEGSFRTSEAERHTSAATRTVVITKTAA